MGKNFKRLLTVLSLFLDIQMTPEDIKVKNNLGTGKFVLFDALTLRIFQIDRIEKTTDLIFEFSEKKIAGDGFVLSLKILLGWYLFLVLCNGFLGIIGNLIGVLYFGLAIYWSFEAKKEIENYVVKNYRINYKLNGLYTFFLNVYYINYCLNDIHDEVSKSEYLRNTSS